MFIFSKEAAILGACVFSLVGCGGSGSDNSDSGNLDPATITWTQGVFEPSSKFDQQCQALNEKHWLRSWSHETYLWYDEIIDRDPALTDGVPIILRY